jgi:hypothetical protein
MASELRAAGYRIALAAAALASCARGPLHTTSPPEDSAPAPSERGDAEPSDTPDDSSANPDAEPQLDGFTAETGESITDAMPSVGCGAFEGHEVFTCSADGNVRGKCPGGMLTAETCGRGCLRARGSQPEAVCVGPSDNFSCTGAYGTERALDGDYYISAFGCWLDANGLEHTDPSDNCIPSCLAQAKREGLCDAADTGKQCEERVNWFTADGARFGCLAHLRVTNPRNGKSLIAVALDFGPGCPGERRVSKAVLDASGRVDRYLFGSDQGAADRSLVHVVEVDSAMPLGPLP